MFNAMRKMGSPDAYMRIEVPALRDRLEDVPELIDRFLKLAAEMGDGKTKRFSSEAIERLCHYSYPGNVRELSNIVQGAYFSHAERILGINTLPVEIWTSETFAGDPSQSLTPKSIFGQLQSGHGSFNELIKNRFLRHKITAATVVKVMELALLENSGNYRNALRLLGVPDDKYASTLQFLKRNDCYLPFRTFRDVSRSRKLKMRISKPLLQRKT